MMAYDNKPIRIKIITSNQAQALEDAYNKFATTHDIVASQYRVISGLFSMSIWYKWDETVAAYDEVKDDTKIMGGEENV